ncbi:MAG: radical SAM protein [archaeon]
MGPELLEVYIEITNKCNLKCIHCLADSNLKASNELTMSEVLFFLNNISKRGVERVTFTGGEPFTRNDFLKVIKKTPKGLSIKIMTNGTLLTSEQIRYLKDLGRDICFQISIDSNYPQTHDMIRGVNGSFEKTRRNVLELVKEGFPVTVVATVMSANISEISSLNYWCSANGICFGLNTLGIMGRANKSLCPTKEDYRELIKNTKCEFLTPIENACGVGFSKISVKPNGDISPCTNFFGLSLGNIKKDDIFEVFQNHPIMKEIRRATVDNIRECKKCPAKKRCGGGCRQRAFAMHGRFDAPDDVMCVLFRKKHKLKLEHPENFPLR